MANKILILPKVSAQNVAKAFARNYGSALFIPGNKATDNFSFLTPHLDFDTRFADVDKLRRELALRGTKIEVNELVDTWKLYKNVDSNKWILENKRNEVAQKMKNLNKKKILSSEETNEKIRLIMQGKVFKQDMKILREMLWEMEETVVVRALRLPNEIHENTPAESSIVMSSVGDICEPLPQHRRNNIDIGRDLGLVDYENPMHYYLNAEAALFELGAMKYAAEIFAKANMLRVAGTDFVRSLVVEASGLDHEDPWETFVLSNNEGIDRETCNRLHLTGGADLLSFLAMHTKQLINPNHFPLKYFATGRQYAPFAKNTTPNGLFTVCQASVAQVFVMAKDSTSEEYTQQFDELLHCVSAIYNDLGVHYRVVLRSARELKPWESLRVSYEMWSSSSKQYVEVGHISISGQYFSKRLLIAYQTPTGRNYPAIISGTVLSVPKILGCLLEENPTVFRIPLKIAEHVPGRE